MTSGERRQAIYEELAHSDKPISATILARKYSVTRQIVVGDIALLRAEGKNVTATPRGYVIPEDAQGNTHQLACCHNSTLTEDELNAFVDCGCTVIDVIVEHPVYGQLTAPLQISSRYDVGLFLKKMRSTEASPLSLLTEGIHLHTIQAPSEEAFEQCKENLRKLGVLLE